MFLCPNCKVKLAKHTGPAGVFWACPACGGRTATVAFLRKVVPREIINVLWQAARRGGQVRKRPCPSCGRRMPEIPIPAGVDTINLDVCPPCQFIWFDSAEYERLPALEVEPTWQETLPEAAREKIAMEQVRMIEERYRDDDLGAAVPDGWWKLIPAVFGVPVEQETKSEFRVPFATWGVSAAVLLVSIVAFTDLENVVGMLGLIPGEAARLGGLTLVTSFFLHAGWWHLLSNLYFLMVFGDNVEERLGAGRFLALLSVATLAGGAAHILGDPRSSVPCIGASGGISGVIAYYALAFPRTRLAFLFWFHWVRMPAVVMFLLWAGLQLLGARAQLLGTGSVSALAHLGGAAMGVVFWFLAREARSESPAARS